MVVVLPVPLTPTTRMTWGRPSPSIRSGLATGASTRSTSAASTARTSSGDDFLVVAALCQGGGNAHGGIDPEICLDQQVLKLLQSISVELPFSKDSSNIL